MDALVVLIPISLFLGLVGLAGFVWTLRHAQYGDPKGDAERILSDAFDDHPMASSARSMPIPPPPPTDPAR
jgi:cbb3-type cytochrome oxidase maturation protein